MINREELAMCRRRGHDPQAVVNMSDGWRQCKWCGMWLREVRTLEEREDEPPEDEQDPLTKLRRRNPPENLR